MTCLCNFEIQFFLCRLIVVGVLCVCVCLCMFFFLPWFRVFLVRSATRSLLSYWLGVCVFLSVRNVVFLFLFLFLGRLVAGWAERLPPRGRRTIGMNYGRYGVNSSLFYFIFDEKRQLL